jgi:hypothetical protein
MELVIFIAALCALAVLSAAFGVDSQPIPGSKEEQLAGYGVTWGPGGWRAEDRQREAARDRLLDQVRPPTSSIRVRLATVLRSIAVRSPDWAGHP